MQALISKEHEYLFYLQNCLDAVLEVVVKT
jgi:hypothetical protein